MRARAVEAYIHGVGLASPEEMAAPAVYLAVTARKERDLLARLRASTAAVADHQAAAQRTQGDLLGVSRQLDDARRQLDRLVAEDDARHAAAQAAAAQAAAQAAADRAASDARRRANAATSGAFADALGRARAEAGTGTGIVVDESSLLPRHRNATRKQAELMARHPFGVLAPGPLPAGLTLTGQTATGLASWYGGEFNGRPTASGAIYDQEGWTAASRTLPLGTLVVVSRNGARVLLLINDRGPYIDGRIIDLSAVAARALGVGVAEVQVEVVAPPA